MERLTRNIDYCETYCENNKYRCPIYGSCINRKSYELAKAYEDAEEQGLLLRLDSKDKLVEILATKLFNSEFGVCYMCTNPMKNVTLDGVNNGCDGGCNTSEEFTVDDFLKKIVSEINRKKALADMGV